MQRLVRGYHHTVLRKQLTQTYRKNKKYHAHLVDMMEKKVGILESMASLNSSVPSPSSAFCLFSVGPPSSAAGFSEILPSGAATSLLLADWLPDTEVGTIVGSDSETSECEPSELARDLCRDFTKLEPSKEPEEDCRFLNGLKGMHSKLHKGRKPAMNS